MTLTSPTTCSTASFSLPWIFLVLKEVPNGFTIVAFETSRSGFLVVDLNLAVDLPAVWLNLFVGISLRFVCVFANGNFSEFEFFSGFWELSCMDRFVRLIYGDMPKRVWVGPCNNEI